ncbi:uncharacterized protein LOC143147633 isoform X2 [Ptiloglossa arizonensis]|uniref:uncharacterized protein LOC143147633 isoform X2 n=1 Tax=Ptiloglossa arizonensis TaxID=3350558 RepID=UPI003FA16743
MIRDSRRIENSRKRKKWIPWRATDLESLMYPNFFIGLVYGCYPYKFESNKYVFSGTRFVYCTFVMINCMCFIFVEIYKINAEDVNNYYLTGKIHSYLFLLSGGCTIVAMYVLSRSRLRLLQSLSEMSRMLSPKDFNDLAKFIHTTDIFSFLVLVVHLPNCFEKDHIMQHLVVFYITQVSLSLDMFYMNCVCILKACFRKLRKNLEQLKETPRNDQWFTKTPWREKSQFNGQRSILSVMRLKRFEEEHLRISNVVQLLNKTFLVHIATLTIMTFVNDTFNLYFYLIWFNGGEFLYASGQFWYTKFLPSVIYQMAKFSIIIWACQTAKTEVLKIDMTVHDVLSSTTDASLKHELMLFALQLLHRENTFSARVVTMNATLLMEEAL